MKKESFPNLLVVSGEQDLLRRRFVQDIKAKQEAQGWTVGDYSSIQEALEEDPFGSSVGSKTLAVVHYPEAIDVEVLEAHLASKSNITLLLHLDGDPDGRTKFGKNLKTSWSEYHKTFPVPTDWKANQVAAEFVQTEARSYNLTIPMPLATALVERSGTDLGVLSFEMMKITILAKKDGATEIGPRHVAKGMAPLAEASAMPIMDALGQRNAKKLARAMAALRRSSRDDPTMRTCRLLESSVVKWLQILYLDAMPPRAIAEELKVNPWYLENKLLPAAQSWGKKRVISLLRDLAASERSVLNGAVDPWVVLTTRLLTACRSA